MVFVGIPCLMWMVSKLLGIYNDLSNEVYNLRSDCDFEMSQSTRAVLAIKQLSQELIMQIEKIDKLINKEEAASNE
jgi:hypothetical protein